MVSHQGAKGNGTQASGKPGPGRGPAGGVHAELGAVTQVEEGIVIAGSDFGQNAPGGFVVGCGFFDMGIRGQGYFEQGRIIAGVNPGSNAGAWIDQNRAAGYRVNYCFVGRQVDAKEEPKCQHQGQAAAGAGDMVENGLVFSKPTKH